MPRSLDAATEAALDDPTTRNAYLLTLNFDPIIRLTSTPFDLTYDGDLYVSSRHLRRVGDVSESAELRVGSTTFEFSGSDQTYIGLVLNNEYVGIDVQYWRVLLDDADPPAVIGSHIVPFDGQISGANLEFRGEEPMVVFECSSHWANWSAPAGRRSNDNSQQALFPGDTCARLAPETIKDVPWGRKG